MAGHPCLYDGCGRPKSAGVHSRHYSGPDAHGYMVKPPEMGMSEGVRNWREQSGYNAEAKAARGKRCQIQSPVCTGRAEHLHEPLSRGRAGGLRRAVEIGGTVDACDPCNGYVMENQVWAREHGFLFRATIEGEQAAREAKEARETAPARTKKRSPLIDLDA